MTVEIYVKSSKREELLDITEDIDEEIAKSGVKSGICVIYTPHTTAAVTINENADPDVCSDMVKALRNISPQDNSYRHSEGNSDAHVKSSLVGATKTVIIENGKLKLGTWQGIYFCEFDGPRSRKVWVKIIAD